MAIAGADAAARSSRGGVMARTATIKRIHFEEDSRLYQDIFNRTQSPHTLEYFHKLLRLFAPGARKVLDVNTCLGDLAIYLAMRGYCVNALEPVEKLYGLAKANCVSNGVTFPVAHSDILSYKSDETFDAVTFKQGIHRVQEPIELLDMFKNIHGRLRAGGVLLFDSPLHAEFHEGRAPFYIHETAVRIQRRASVPLYAHTDRSDTHTEQSDALVTSWNIATKDYRVQMDSVSKIYPAQALSAMLSQACFTDVKFFDASLCMGFVRIPEARPNSSMIICVARKSI